jgi:hypothetical protein
VRVQVEQATGEVVTVGVKNVTRRNMRGYAATAVFVPQKSWESLGARRLLPPCPTCGSVNYRVPFNRERRAGESAALLADAGLALRSVGRVRRPERVVVCTKCQCIASFALSDQDLQSKAPVTDTVTVGPAPAPTPDLVAMAIEAQKSLENDPRSRYFIPAASRRAPK